VTIAQVVDGDTVRLTSGESVRLLGINTPERGYDGRADQPFAAEASAVLRGLVPPDGRMQLVPGVRATDRHGRRLGYLIRDRISVGDELVSRGLAWAVAVPPEAGQWACLSALEDAARADGQGFWSDGSVPARYRDRRARTGFVHLAGRITRSDLQDDGRWFGELDGELWLTAYTDALAEFPDLVQVRAGAWVEVRGWLSSGRRPRLVIRHPSQLRKVTELPPDAGL
jgi:endonuclease YncB( thermonuclease family)